MSVKWLQYVEHSVTAQQTMMTELCCYAPTQCVPHRVNYLECTSCKSCEPRGLTLRLALPPPPLGRAAAAMFAARTSCRRGARGSLRLAGTAAAT
eukprot:6182494-Pleurochrysis_carterae.AAC.2